MNPFQKMTCILRRSLHFLIFSRYLVLYTTLGLSAFFMLTGCAQEPGGPLFKVSDASYKSITDAVFETISSQVFFVGEHHDNPHRKCLKPDTRRTSTNGLPASWL